MGVYNKWRKFPAGMLSHSVSQGFLLIINGFVNFDSFHGTFNSSFSFG